MTDVHGILMNGDRAGRLRVWCVDCARASEILHTWHDLSSGATQVHLRCHGQEHLARVQCAFRRTTESLRNETVMDILFTELFQVSDSDIDAMLVDNERWIQVAGERMAIAESVLKSRSNR